MAKEAGTGRSQKSPSSSPSASTQSTQRAAHGRMVLRVRSTEGTKRSLTSSASIIDQEEARTMSARKPKRKKRSKKLDAKKPKKPPTAFFYFLEDFRKQFQEQNPAVKSMRDIGKACGVKWKTMTYEEKVQYYDIATEKRAEFDMAMAEYIKRQETGEDEETEDDDLDFDE
ncbi:hypothetical protein UlMin_018894 [Ulmus minor]